MRWILSAFFFFFVSLACSQEEAGAHGTIKIGQKKDSVYIKAIMQFDKFMSGKKRREIRSDNITAPFPFFRNSPVPFDYSAFFNTATNRKELDMKGKKSDTVRIMISVTEQGKFKYSEIARSSKVNGVAVYYDKDQDRLMQYANHYAAMSTLKKLTAWNPGFITRTVKDKFKGVTVIKQEKEWLFSTGVLTVIYSSVPFQD